MRKISILGIRGIPAAHGGFETFAERLALYLTSKGWSVTVYCQTNKPEEVLPDWNGVKRTNISVMGDNALSTILFDFKTVFHTRKVEGLNLTLGYNTAVFNLIQRIYGITNIINMDGIEWKRKKWGPVAKAWFWLNERIGCYVGNHLIADHPEIERHLSSRISSTKITMIPYGADSVSDADTSLIEQFGLSSAGYAIVIARAEPENSLLEIVKAFSAKRRPVKLVVLGKYDAHSNSYHAAVKAAASDQVVFLGAIYDKPTVNALRYFSHLYVHGHQVGGTNPSLVEAMGAGNAVLAHDNKYNRWVAGECNRYFNDERQCAEIFDELLPDDRAIDAMRQGSLLRFREQFTWDKILSDYERLLLHWYPD